MLAPKIAAAAGKTTHRFRSSVSHSVHGLVELPLGRSAIHGELLNLGITVSERTVSRYVRDRMRAPSQSWRTFLANELGQLVAFASTVTSSDEPRDHDVADARLCVIGDPSSS
jgi:hypothetical protein